MNRLDRIEQDFWARLNAETDSLMTWLFKTGRPVNEIRGFLRETYRQAVERGLYTSLPALPEPDGSKVEAHTYFAINAAQNEQVNAMTPAEQLRVELTELEIWRELQADWPARLRTVENGRFLP